MTKEKETMTVAQAAAQLGLNQVTIYNYIGSTLIGDRKTWTVDKASVDVYEQHRKTAHIKNLDAIQAILAADDGLTNDQRGYTPGCDFPQPLPLDGPSDQERMTLKLRGEEFLSLREIEERVGVNHERVRQIINRAVERLYQP